MTDMFQTLIEADEIENNLYRGFGFEEGRRYEKILDELKSVENIGSGNQVYVEEAITRFDAEINQMKKNYEEKVFEEYSKERSRLIKQLGKFKLKW